ncbi:MAG TPA: 4Fe-4S binding protein [Thermoanaerobacterales bacterium]|nr:4Fe-4S binding protein [Thermoanaerobacterales bacterium]
MVRNHVENYSLELLNDPGRRTYIEQFVPRVRKSSKDKCYINTEKCYGCGLCRVACKTQAIELFDIEKIFVV